MGRLVWRGARADNATSHGYSGNADGGASSEVSEEAQKEEGEEKYSSPSKASDKENLFQFSSFESNAASCSPPSVCFVAWCL
ncbi:hypothetical protein KSB_69460 [Ktedonobacter robiniae]|uniref:Uncharacterized protein n=1 Tax=Ktedonobacter robiniae TaxID=2778365 RepID=A0ABQ3V0H1_9CHLR|nr:hypothetical protein KSB_69460 [Ktedonobacter robiniae]